MKFYLKIIQIVVVTFPLFWFSMLRGQEKIAAFETDSRYEFYKNDEKNPCISPEEYDLLNKEVADNIKKFRLDTRSTKSALATSLLWPLKQASGFTQCEYHFIAAYVDQNTATTAIQDYNCESNTYDGHHGTDIAIWPYAFNKMENNEIEVVAAAPGTII